MTIYGRSEELGSRCVECDLAEPESLASLGGSAPGLVDGILSAIEEEFLLEDEYNDDFDKGSEERSEGDKREATSDVYETTTPGAGTDELDLDQVFTTGVEAIHQGKVNAKHLAKIWRISYDDAT